MKRVKVNKDVKRMWSILLGCFMWALCIGLLTACKQRAPRGVLSAGELEDVLYDYHMAQGLAQQMASDSVDYFTRLYQAAALKKHGITLDEFNRSMAWYARHTKALNDVYTNLSKRFGANVDEGSSQPGMAEADYSKLSGDTVLIKQLHSFALFSSIARHHACFTADVDTAVRANDLLQWRFDVSWHSSGSFRQGVALMTLHYEGDSTASYRQSFSASGAQVITMPVAKRKLLRVKGFIYQCAAWTERPQLMVIRDERLLRLRRQEVAQPETDASLDKPTINQTATMRQHLRDSLLRDDTVQLRRPHFK